MQSISANRLTDGIVVFLASGERWVEDLAEAAVFADKPTTEAALLRAKAAEAANIVVDAYAFDVVVDGSLIRAAHLREAIRAAGPTVHRDHGKQANKPVRDAAVRPRPVLAPAAEPAGDDHVSI